NSALCLMLSLTTPRDRPWLKALTVALFSVLFQKSPTSFLVVMVGKTVAGLGFLLATLASAAPATSHDPVVKDIDGITHHPLAPGDKMGSVLIFYLQDCPICNGYAPEINRIAETFTNFAFYIVQVDPDLKLEAAKRHAQQYELHPP